MKKIFISISLLLSAFLLVACNGVEVDLIEVELPEITYASGDSVNSVTTDITLPISAEKKVVVSWESSNEAVIAISGKTGTVKRLEADTKVSLTPTLTGPTKNKLKLSAIELTVIAEGGAPVGDEAYSFLFNSTGLSNSYAENIDKHFGVTNIVNDASHTFTVSRGSDQSANSITGLVLSGGGTKATVAEAWVSVLLPKTVSKIEFSARFWSTSDKEKAEKLVIEQKVGDTWTEVKVVDHSSISSEVGIETVISVTGITSSSVRIYLKGDDTGYTKGNDVRFVISGVKFFL